MSSPISTILKRRHAFLEDEDEDDEDQFEERNKCRLCGKTFIRLALHKRSCRQDPRHASQILSDARQTLADRRIPRNRPMLARFSNFQEVLAKSGTTESPQQSPTTESAEDIEVSRNHPRFLQSQGLTNTT